MAGQVLFPRLFERSSIGKLKLRNRLVMLPMGVTYATPGGEATQRTLDYYTERAKGGVSLIIVGAISPYLTTFTNQLVLDSDAVLMGHFELVEKVHACGAKIAAQLLYPGRQDYVAARNSRRELVSSSPLASTLLGETSAPARALSKDEIYQFIARYASAAERAKRVGYDMVELHGAHGYLINQFISPFMNRRTDEFGGSLENRMRFPLELIKAVREASGPDFPIGFRLSAVEFVPGGITLEESTTIARMLEAAGVAYISVSAGIMETYHDKLIGLMRDAEGWKEYIWEAIKKEVKVPVIAGGGLRHPDFCERVLAEGKADFIGLARPLLADPEWPRKAKEGQIEDIRLCISCNECIFGSANRRRGGSGARYCAVNAATGREREFAVVLPAPVRKKVMVIGGGPAGMEAARIAALRGHRVTLYESQKELGGQMLIAGRPRSKQTVLWLRDYLVTQLKKLGVGIKLGVKVTPDLVAKIKPDAVVVATGARPLLPDIPGIKGQKVINAWDLLREKDRPEKERVTIIGGGLVGCEVADYLLESDNKVTIIEQLPTLAAGMEPTNRYGMLEIFKEKGVVALTNHRVTGITENGVKAIDQDNREEFIPADMVVIAVGGSAVDTLAAALEDKYPELYVVGDCNRPRVIMEAIYEGSLAGRQI